MAKMSNIDLTIKDIKNWFKEKGITIIILMILFILMHAIGVQEDLERRAKDERINDIDKRLTKQEYYMHKVQADLNNLKEVQNEQ